MNKDDAELFGILKKSEDFPKSNFIMKLVKVGFKCDDICKKLEPMLLGKCTSVGVYGIPNCTSYVLIWASTTEIAVASSRSVISKQLKLFTELALKMELCEDIHEVKHRGQKLLVSRSIPQSYVMSYVIADVHENQMKRINKLDDFVEIASTLLADLEKGLDDKWSEGMAYYDFFKFLSKRVSRFTCRYAEDTFE